MPQMLSPHPAAIPRYLSRALYLLVFPVARGLLLALRGGTLLAWARAAWFDLLVLLLMIGVALLRWRLTGFWVDNRALCVRQGVLFRSITRIPLANLSAVSVEYRLLLLPFRAVVLRADTPGGPARGYDFELVVRRADAARVLDARVLACGRAQHARRVLFPHSLHIAALAAFLSNSFAGVVYAGALFSRAGDIVGERLQGRVFTLLAAVSQSVSSVSRGIPPLAALLALVVLGGWFIGFVQNLLRLTRFRVSRSGPLLQIDSGLLTRRRYCVDTAKVFYLDIRQSVMTRLLRIYLVFIRCTGYGKGKNEAAVLVPSATRHDLAFTLSGLLPGIRPHTRTLCPARGAWLRYLFFPLLLGAGLFALYRAAVCLLPTWDEVLRFVLLMSYVPTAWLLSLKLVDYLTAGLSFEQGTLTLRCSRGFVLHTVAIKPCHIALLTVRQSLWQQKNGSCDLLVYGFSESGLRARTQKAVHRVKSLPLSGVSALLGL